MNKIVDWFKDFIYNITDYGIIVGVIAVVAAVLVWRFDILFNTNIQKDPIVADNNAPIISTTPNNTPTDDTTKEPGDEVATNTPQTPQDNNTVVEPKPDTQIADNNTGKEVEVTIPAGSYPSKIAEILVNAGLIDDKAAFLDRSVALSLDTKLKSGDFTIAQGESVDNILKILSK